MEYKLPLVSVIVTTYNREHYLTDTIQSILNQTFKDFELIVVDNHSNYDFYALIDSFGDSRIKPFQNHNNGIIAVNRNFGIKQSSGQYLAFCDDDDLWVPNKLERQIQAADGKDKVIVSSYREIIDDKAQHKRDELWTYKNKFAIYYRNKIALSSVLISNSQDVIFEENRTFFAMEDYCLWLKLFHIGYNLIIVPEILIQYREGNNNTGRIYTYLPPKEIAYLSFMIIQYKDSSSVLHYIIAVLRKLFLFARYLYKSRK